MPTIKLPYAKIAMVHYEAYVLYGEELARKFPGEAFELNEAAAAFMAEMGWCYYGGACVIFAILDGQETREWRTALDAWEDEDSRRDWGNSYDDKEIGKKRWLALFEFAERHVAKRPPIGGIPTATVDEIPPMDVSPPKAPVRVITAAQIKAAGACGSGVETFRRLFGEQAEVTEENIRKASADMPVEWLGRATRGFLSPEKVFEFKRGCEIEYGKCEASGGKCTCYDRTALLFMRLYNEDAPASAEGGATAAA